MRKLIFIIIGLFSVVTISLIASSYLQVKWYESQGETPPPNTLNIFATPKPKVTYKLPSTAKTIPLRTHVFQSFNNCGPASFSMLLSYFDVTMSQQTLGNKLRPYQNPQGDNDDKNVFVSEIAAEAVKMGFVAYHRPNGSLELLKTFVANDIPVLTRTTLSENEDIGHFRIVRGFNDTRNVFIQDDSLQGKDLDYDYQTFLNIWEPYHFEYLVIAPKEKQALLEAIIGDDVDELVAWKKVYTKAKAELAEDPESLDANWSISISAYHLERYAETVSYFEKVKSRLSKRTLWYQIEPVDAYLKLGEHEKLLNLTQEIFNGQNRAFSELYYLRGLSYMNEGEEALAQEEFDKAVFYNASFASIVPKI